MRCFLPCFGSSKRQKHIVSEGHTHPTLESAVTELTEQTIDYITQSKINFVARSNSRVRKKVTVDLNVNISKELSIKELFNKLEESKREQGKAREDEMLLNPKLFNKMSGCTKAIAQSKSSNPSDTRYQGNSENGKNREEDDNGEVDWKLLQEESSESLFSLSIDCTKQVSADEKAENEVDSLMPHHNTVYFTKEEPNLKVSKMLNPNDNFAEEKTVKGTGIQPLKNEGIRDVYLLRRKLGEQSNGIDKRKVSTDLNLIAKDEQEKAREEAIQISESPAKSMASIRPSSNSSNYRCQDYPNERYEDINLYENNFKDTSVDVDPGNEEKVEGEVNGTWCEESSESLFSLSIDSRKQISAAEKPDNDNEVNSQIPVRDKLCSKEEEREAFGSSRATGARIQHASSSVLNPIENPTQWKFVKTTIVQPLKHEEKENVNIMQDNDVPYTPKPSLKLSDRKSRKKLNDEEGQTGVDISLSSWLVGPKTRESKNSMNSVGDSDEGRPLLGALTTEERRQFSASTSPTLTPGPDETLIIGTFGSYWSHTGQAVDFNIAPDSGCKSPEVLLS